MLSGFGLSSLRTRLALFSSLAIVLVMALTGTVSYLENKSRLRSMQLRHLNDVVDRLADDIDERVRTRHVLLEQAAANLQLSVDDIRTRPDAILGSLRYLKGNFNSVVLYDAAGNIVADYPELPGRRGLNVVDRDYFIATRKSLRSQISEPLRTRGDLGRSVIVFTSPLLDAQGQFSGMLGGSLELFSPELFGELRSLAIGYSGYLTIHSRRSRLTLFDRDRSRIMQPLQVENAMLAAALNGQDGSAETPLGGGPSGLVAYRNLQSVAWVVGGVYPVSEAYRPVQALLREQLLIVALALLLALPLGWWGAGWLLMPLLALRRKVRALADGSGQDIRIAGSQELQALANTVAEVFEERERIGLALAEREAFFRALGDSSPLGVFVADADGRICYCNGAALALGGVARVEEDWLGRPWLEAVHPTQRQLLADDWALLCSGEIGDYYRLCRLSSPQPQALLVELRFTRLQQQGSVRFLGVVHDVSLREQALADTRAERERAQAVLESIADAVVLTNQHDEVCYINPPAQRLLGVKAEEAQGRALHLFFSLSYPDSGVPVSLPTLGERHHTQAVELDLLSRDMRLLPVVLTLSVVQTSGSMQGYKVCVLHDDSERRRRERTHRWEATHDPLTGLFNRRGLLSALTELLTSPDARRQSNCVAMLDLDHFKQVNDSGGHQAGDQLLQDISALIQRRLRTSDIVARLGGDEFALILYNCPRATAERILHELGKDIAALALPGLPLAGVQVTASIGLTQLQDDDMRPHDILQRADQRCYHAKYRGRNQLVAMAVE